MASVHRAIFIWFWLLIFVIFLVLRLEEKVEWNWLVVFLPVWILDSAFFGASVVRCTHAMKTRPRSSGSNANSSNLAAQANHALKVRRSVGAAAASILALIFQIMLCIRLQYAEANHFLSLYYVMIPFWFLLSIILVDLTYRLVQIYRN